MNPHLTFGVAQAHQQELLRRSEEARLATELPGRPTLVQRLAHAIPSLSIARRHSSELPRAAEATTDA